MSKNNIFLNKTKLQCGCLNCNDRHIGCQSECNNYKKFKQNLNRHKNILIQEKISKMSSMSGWSYDCRGIKLK